MNILHELKFQPLQVDFDNCSKNNFYPVALINQDIIIQQCTFKTCPVKSAAALFTTIHMVKTAWT